MQFHEAGVARPPEWPRVLERHLAAKTHASLQRRAATVSAGTPGASSSPQHTDTASSTPCASTSAPQPATAASPHMISGSRAASVAAPYQFSAVGFDATRFLAAGCVSALPKQFGIRGFQRFTMMKYLPRDDDDDDDVAAAASSADSEDPSYTPWPSDVAPAAEAARTAPQDPREIDVEANDLWAYEGVVLPGGQVVVGRWWRPDEAAPLQGVSGERPPEGEAREGSEAVYSGPFVFWCVDV